MELFHELFAGLLLFVYHCFDRMVRWKLLITKPMTPSKKSSIS
jgi:hypothetical protein